MERLREEGRGREEGRRGRGGEGEGGEGGKREREGEGERDKGMGWGKREREEGRGGREGGRGGEGEGLGKKEGGEEDFPKERDIAPLEGGRATARPGRRRRCARLGVDESREGMHGDSVKTEANHGEARAPTSFFVSRSDERGGTRRTVGAVSRAQCL